MRHSVSREIHERWDALRGAEPAPAGGDVDPAAIRRVLASAFVIEAARGARPRDLRDATFLLAGTRVDALFGRPLRGDTFDRIWSPQSREQAAAMLDGVVEDGPPTVAAVRGGAAGSAEAAMELMLLPLGVSGSGRWRVLGSLAVLSRPDWIGLRPTRPLELLSCRALPDPAARRDPDGDGDVAVRIGRFTVHRGGRDRRMPAAATP